MTKATLSPSVHESVIRRHFSKDDDTDSILNALHDGVRMAREMSNKAAAMTAEATCGFATET